MSSSTRSIEAIFRAAVASSPIGAPSNTELAATASCFSVPKISDVTWESPALDLPALK
jgi:hypothetical protein